MRKGITMWQTARSAEVDQLIKEIDGQKQPSGKAA
jgi:hypothetical protein